MDDLLFLENDEDLVNMIQENEESGVCKLKPYTDSLGFLTIGWGHCIDKRGLPMEIREYLDEHGQITQQMADELFTLEIAECISGVRGLFFGFKSFSKHRKFALIDLAFNLGITGLSKFHTMRGRIESGDWHGAAEALMQSRYAKQVPNRARHNAALLRLG